MTEVTLTIKFRIEEVIKDRIEVKIRFITKSVKQIDVKHKLNLLYILF